MWIATDLGPTPGWPRVLVGLPGCDIVVRMGLGPADRLAVAAGKRLQGLPLTPEDYFVLSRVEGQVSVGEVLATSGLDEGTTREILERLVELGALQVTAAAAADSAPRRRPTSSMDLRQAAAERRRRLLARQLGGGGEGASDKGRGGDSRREQPSAAPRKVDSTPRAPPPTTMQVGGTLDPVSAQDPRLDSSLGIGVSDQRRLLAIKDRMAELNPFELFGLEPTNDEKLIRRAYFEASRQLHPDRYYQKELGIYQDLLATLFGRAKKAYGVLLNREKREPYVAQVLAARERQARIEAEVRAREEAALQKAEEEAQHKREEEAAVEREARRRRDEKRKRRQRGRLADGMKSKAREHYDMGIVALGQEKYASAANHFRMAKQLDRGEPEYEERWQHALGIARQQRAEAAFGRAEQLEEMGHPPDAIALFVEAAEAHGSPNHLSHAAFAIRDQDPGRAREFALRALDALAKADGEGVKMSPLARAEFHIRLARAFHAAGQKNSALEQAKIAETHAPEAPVVKTLLKSLRR